MKNKQKELIKLDLTKYPQTHDFTYKGCSCEMRRNLYKAWCGGYVQIPNNSHPLYYASYDKISELLDNYIHGGITYGWDSNSRFFSGYFGFDCSHYDDITPIKSYRHSEFATYKDYNFVVNEIKKLVDFFINYKSKLN